MKIIQAPNPILTTPTKRVSKIDDKVKKIATDMIAIMQSQTEPEGVGLAANQVGLDLSLFVMQYDKKKPPLVCLNPRVLKHETHNMKHKSSDSKLKTKQKNRLEGCLSIKNIWARVDRAGRTQLSWTDLAGKKNTRWFSDFAATIVQHEVDHLEGVLFTQRSLTQGKKLYKEVRGELEEYQI